MSELFIGVMSGTSLDAIDISLCEISKDRCIEIHSGEYPYDAKLKVDILYAIANPITLKQVGELNYSLAKAYASALSTFISTNKIDKTKVQAVGLHGQTLWHEPNSTKPFSMQLGDASLVSKLVGIDVVSDFRSGDVALGGQGAPFTPAFHKFIFDYETKKVAVLNLGGIANLSILSDKLVGFDTGPANILMDLWIQKKQSKKYDENGTWAKSGNSDARLLKRMLDEMFFKKNAPKSTGRELFNESWLDEKLIGLTLSDEDVQATLLELTLMSVKNELLKYKVNELLVCGGGSRNEYLMLRLAEELPHIDVKTTDNVGVASSSLEAMAFAWLAYKRVAKEEVGLKDVTGASRDTVLGAIYASN